MGTTGDDFGSIPTPFLLFFGAVIAMMACIVVLAVVMALRNRRVFREAGIDPGTVGSQLAVRYLRGQSGRPAVRSASDRLAELTDLRDRGLITATEYDARRAQIIAEL
ncbi:MAG TPA: SHOCT domain-containing protein [Jatrophihabitans sp.]|jgi:hypothetical protein|nr:SHOCT domain-containing protein [Jatrophihabitans sp.]